MQAVKLLSIALVAANAAAAEVSSKFTKVTSGDGEIKRFFDLSPDAQSTIQMGDGSAYAPKKLLIDPIKMTIDLTDLTFSDPAEKKDGDAPSALDLSGTLFTFKDGTKSLTLSPGQQKVEVQVDNEALMKKYGFIYDHAPQLWLSEDDDGFWPASVQEYFNHMYGVSRYHGQESKLMLTTRIPLKSVLDSSQPFMHGVRPVDGKSFPVHTFLLPVKPEDGTTDMDPLEMLLNPESEESLIEAAYIYFFAYDATQEGLGFHLADLEKTKV